MISYVLRLTAQEVWSILGLIVHSANNLHIVSENLREYLVLKSLIMALEYLTMIMDSENLIVDPENQPENKPSCYSAGRPL